MARPASNSVTFFQRTKTSLRSVTSSAQASFLAVTIFANGQLVTGFLQTAQDGKKALQLSSITMVTLRLETVRTTRFEFLLGAS